MSHPLLRTLISEMVETYLEESYGDDLIESIFDEVSEETWEAIEEAILDELSPETYDLYVEGSLKKGTPERKMKDAFRRGEAKTRDFYSGKSTSSKFKAPKTPGEKAAQEAGKKAGDGSPTAKGSRRTSSQDSLKNTEHTRSEPSSPLPGAKTHYKTQTHSSKMYGMRKSNPKLPK
jgi:hypothetical protein